MNIYSDVALNSDVNSIKYKFSVYNHTYKYDRGILLYNSLTGFKAHIYERKLLLQINRLKKGELLSRDKIDMRLIESGIAIEENLDETVIADSLIRENIASNSHVLRLIILPTRECNFRCVYCYENKRGEFMRDELYSEIASAIKNYIDDNPSINALEIEWFGGEPMLCYDKIVEFSAGMKRYCDEKDIIFSMAMTTNGYLLTKERFLTLLKLNLRNYQITVDGNKEHHDKLRVLKNGGGTWDTIFNNLREINETDDKNFNITVRINYHLGMLDEMEGFLRELKESLDINGSFSVYAIKITPPPGTDLDIDFVTNETDRMAAEYTLKLFKKLGISTDRYSPHLIPTAPVCYARKNNTFVIDTDGTIRKCTEYLEDNTINNVGTVKDGVFLINNYKHAQWLMPPQSLLNKKGCPECPDYPTCCGGICPIQWFRDKTIYCNDMITLTEDMLRIEYETPGNNHESLEKQSVSVQILQ